MIEKVEKTMLAHGMFPFKSVLVGLSGGADSAALLSVLCALSESYGFTVYAAHVNHGLRGAEADRDEEFSKRLAASLGVEFFCFRADVRSVAAERGVGEELAGREVRYEFFKKITDERGIDVTATAHHKNDNAETILMNFMRGTGLKGLCGIPYRRDGIIRPLLDVTRAEIEAYCDANGIEYVTDGTNLKTVYTRNKARHILIPEIERLFNPSFVDTVSKNAAVLTAEEDYISEAAERAYSETVFDNAVATERLCSLHRAIAMRVIRRMVSELCGTEDVPAAVIESVLELAQKNRTGSQIDIARGCAARIEYGRLILSEKKADTEYFEYEITPGVPVYIPELGYSVLAEPCEEYKRDGGEYFTAPKGCKITVRRRKSGDKFCPWGMRGTKKLKDFMIDEKIPREKRSRTGILTFDDEIAWVIGYRRDRRFKFDKSGIKISILSE